MPSEIKITRGLLGPSPSLIDPYLEKLEKLRADFLLFSLPNRFTYQGIMASAFDAENLAYEKGLIAFALKERISFFNDAWRQRTMEAAARMYILEQSKKRGRGRPSRRFKQNNVGLLGGQAAKTSELELVNAVRAKFVKKGKTVSDARLIRSIISYQEFDGKQPTSERDRKIFEAHCRGYANKVSRQRTNRGTGIRLGKSHK